MDKKKASDIMFQTVKQGKEAIEKMNKSIITKASIPSRQIIAGKINFDFKKLSPEAKLQFKFLSKRIKALHDFDKAFDKAHPILKHIKYWSIIRTWYHKKRLEYILRKTR